MKKIAIFTVLCLAVLSTAGSFKAFSANAMKIGYIDLRKVFYEYEKSKNYDKELNDISAQHMEERNKLVEDIKTMRDQAQLLNDKAKDGKEAEINTKINELNELDRDTRQEFLTKKNDMFKEVLDDINVVVTDIGSKDKYDYIMDLRNLMYAKEGFDLTGQVITKLNKK